MLSSIFYYRCILALNPLTFWLHSIVCYEQGNRTIFIGYGSGYRSSISIKIWTEFRFSWHLWNICDFLWSLWSWLELLKVLIYLFCIFFYFAINFRMIGSISAVLTLVHQISRDPVCGGTSFCLYFKSTCNVSDSDSLNPEPDADQDFFMKKKIYLGNFFDQKPWNFFLF